jgi:hypothetical protein
MGADHRQFTSWSGAGLGVVEGPVFVISQHGAVFVQVDQVVRGQQWNFASAAGSIDYKVGDAHAAGVALQGLDDLEAVSTDVRK